MIFSEKNKNRLWFAFASVGYIGLVPVAPGTVASLAATIMLWFFPGGYPVSWIVLSLAVFYVGVIAASNVERANGVADPSYIVIDEVIGMAVSVWLLPKSILWYVLAFCLFRFFDIVKPFPIKIVERRLPGGWGVMTDDLVAGVMTWVIIQAFVRVF